MSSCVNSSRPRLGGFRNKITGEREILKRGCGSHEELV